MQEITRILTLYKTYFEKQTLKKYMHLIKKHLGTW